MTNGNRSKLFLAIFGFIILIIIISSLFTLASTTSSSVSLFLAYAAGLSMIFLPCTLPLAFIVVPLTMGHKPEKGLLMAILFGLGISVTLAFYGVLTAGLGSYLGLDKTTRIMFTIAGVASLIFGLSELKLLRLVIPSFSGTTPLWIQEKKDYTRIFFMGLFLGNAGVGCPNPAFYVLLTHIASVGSLVAGGWLGFIHGLGRATPLIFLAILGLLGINSLKWISKKRLSIDRVMGWGLVVVGAFILTYGIFGMPWWEDSIFHANWNSFIYNIVPVFAESPSHPIAQGFFVGSFLVGWAFFLGIIILVIIYSVAKRIVSYKKTLIVLSLLLIILIMAMTGTIKAKHSHGVDNIYKEQLN